jgi:hypothetical protein
MMNCKDIENSLPLYLDNLLSAADKRAIEEHLTSCPQCAKALARLQNTGKLVDGLGEVDPPPWFKQKIMARVREEAEKKSFTQKWFYPLHIKIPVQIMATIVIAVLAVYIYRSGDEQMKAVLSPTVPAPVMKVQKNQLPEQKAKTSADEAIRKEEVIQKEGQPIQTKRVPREYVSEEAADAAKDVNEQIIHDIKADKYESAPAAKAIALPEAQLEKKKESNILGAARKASRAPQVQNIMATPNILLRVADINATAGEVEKLLLKYEAKNISRQMAQGKVVLTAELKNQKIKDFTMRLKTLGQVEEVNVHEAYREGNISFVIEIVNK